MSWPITFVYHLLAVVCLGSGWDGNYTFKLATRHTDVLSQKFSKLHQRKLTYIERESIAVYLFSCLASLDYSKEIIILNNFNVSIDSESKLAKQQIPLRSKQ